MGSQRFGLDAKKGTGVGRVLCVLRFSRSVKLCLLNPTVDNLWFLSCVQLSGTSHVGLAAGLCHGGLRLPPINLIQAGVRAEGAAVRPGLMFSTVLFRDGSLGSH